MPRLKSDLVEVMLACAERRLDEIELEWRDEWAVSVVLTSAGYPGSYEKGKAITGIEDAEAMENVTVYHAGTAHDRRRRARDLGRPRARRDGRWAYTFEAARDLAYVPAIRSTSRARRFVTTSVCAPCAAATPGTHRVAVLCADRSHGTKRVGMSKIALLSSGFFDNPTL